MTSLADLGEISKVQSQEQRDRNIGQAALTGGGVATGGGLLAGGIPGAIPRTEGMELKRGKPVKLKPKHMTGGIIGFREQAHKKRMDEVSGWDELDQTTPGRVKATHHTAFQYGNNPGMARVEREVIPDIRRAKHGSHALLGAGLLTAGYGAHKIHQANKAKQQQKPLRKDYYTEDQQRKAAKMVGGGLGTGAVGLGVGGALGHYGRKYGKHAKQYQEEAERAVPAIKGKHPKEVMGQHDIFQGHTKEEAHLAGRRMGQVKQAKYVSNVYNAHAKPLMGVGLAGLGVAAAGAHKMKRNQQREQR